MKQTQRTDDSIVTIEVTREWLECFQKAIFQDPSGRWCRVGWIEPLVDTGRVRVMTVPVETEWAIPHQVDGNLFSRN